MSQGHACHTASVLHIQCHTFSYTTWYHTGSVTGLNNVTGLYRQCHRTPQTVGLLTSHNPWLHKVSHQSTTHCHRPIFKMSQSVSHIATLLHKASRGCQGLEASLSLSLSLSHTHTHTHTHTHRGTQSYMDAGFVSSSTAPGALTPSLSNHPLPPKPGYGVLEVKTPRSPGGQAPNCSIGELRAPPGRGIGHSAPQGSPPLSTSLSDGRAAGVSPKQKDTEVRDTGR